MKKCQICDKKQMKLNAVKDAKCRFESNCTICNG